jgi:hypothetical protein
MCRFTRLQSSCITRVSHQERVMGVLERPYLLERAHQWAHELEVVGEQAGLRGTKVRRQQTTRQTCGRQRGHRQGE